MGTWNPPGGPTSGNDRFTGDASAENANGGAGDDRLIGNGGADTLEGGAGADIVVGGAGNDIVIVRGDIVSMVVVDDVESGESLGGGAGIDTLQVQGQVAFTEADVSLSSFEQLTFLANDDPYNTLSIRASLLGPGLSLTLAVTGVTGINSNYINVMSDSVGATIDVSGWTFANWSQGVVQLYGDTGVNSITGSDVRDAIDGKDGADILRGGDGDDDLLASAFASPDGAVDHMYGGRGNDLYVVQETGDKVHELVDAGYDTVHSFINYTLSANLEGLWLRGTIATTATGNDVDNTVYGNDIDNMLFALGGADYMDGGDGNDTLDGGTGVDYMVGRDGNDIFIFDNLGDFAEEQADEGTDLVRSSVNVTLSANVENLTLQGAAVTGKGNGLNNKLIGNGGDNVLSGLAGNDVITGSGGDDTLNGGVGMDTLNGGAGADTFVFDRALTPGNVDAINAFSVADDTIRLENSIFAGLAVGAMAASRFTIGAEAGDAGDRIIYDAATGALYFDADGTGAGAQLQFATLAAGLALTAADFVVT